MLNPIYRPLDRIDWREEDDQLGAIIGDPPMPTTPPRACPCGGKITNGTCDRCGPRRKDTRTPEDQHTRNVLYGRKWKEQARAFLTMHPLCVLCENHLGRTVPATVVDHIVPHRGDPALFWEPDNWQPLCKPCHDAKTGRGE